MRFVHTLRFLSFPAIVLGTALTLACGDGSPTAPDEAPSLAVTSGPLSVDPRSLRITCNAGLPCTGGMYVHSASPVTLSYQIDGGDFIINPLQGNCPQDGTLAASCYLSVKVTTTDIPGRRTATLVLSESTFGTSLSVRLAARVR
jgi:hypothetical protein